MLTLDNEQINELLVQGHSDPFVVVNRQATRIVLYKTTATIKHVLTGKLYKAEFMGDPSEVVFTEVVGED